MQLIWAGLLMRSQLQLAVWAPATAVVLKTMEDEIKAAWQPPLNLDIAAPWKRFVRARSARLTAQAAATPPSRSD